MTRFRAMIVIVGMLGVAVLVSACGGGSSSSESSSEASSGASGEKTHRIGVEIPAVSDPYFSEMQRGLEAAAKQNPEIKLEYAFDPESPPSSGSEELPGIEALITKEVEAILIADGFDTTKPLVEE